MNVSELRAATREDHEAVEGTMPLMRPDLSRELYVATLRRLYEFVAAWEQLADSRLDGPLQEIARRQQRLALLAQDLKFFGLASQPSLRAAMPSLSSTAAILGAMYVMEGSRLGGQLIARHVEEVLHLQPRQGTSFFRGYDRGTRQRWREFLDTLSNCVDDADAPEVISGAKKMFRAFGEWMQAAEPTHSSPPR